MLLKHFLQCKEQLINPFSTNVLLLYSLKTQENQTFSDVFSEYRSATLVENGLNGILLATSKKKNSMELSLKRIIKSVNWIKKVTSPKSQLPILIFPFNEHPPFPYLNLTLNLNRYPYVAKGSSPNLNSNIKRI